MTTHSIYDQPRNPAFRVRYCVKMQAFGRSFFHCIFRLPKEVALGHYPV